MSEVFANTGNLVSRLYLVCASRTQSLNLMENQVQLPDTVLHEQMAHFTRERIPERMVSAKGSGAYGTFTVTHDISRYTRARLLDRIGKETRVFVRFSRFGGEKGSADTERDPRGFAVRFYTEDGNWDLVGSNTPVFFVKDPARFPDFIHTQQRDSYTNLKSPTLMWEYWSQNPESLHQLLMLMSERGTPVGYRFMNGYGLHTFSFINAGGERFWVKFHLKSMQGIRTFTADEAEAMKARDMDFAQRDLLEAIDNGHFPKWALTVQIMPEADAKTYRWNPFDPTKVWPHADYPLINVGVLELNQNPENYFQDVEQSAFTPAQVVDGIGYSPDKMLLARLLSYSNAHHYRLGANYGQIPVNRSDSTVADPNTESAQSLNSFVADGYDRTADGRADASEHDHYTQPGNLFRSVMTPEQQMATVQNIVGAMRGISGPQKDQILFRQLCHFFRADMSFGMAIARGLRVNVDQFMPTAEGRHIV